MRSNAQYKISNEVWNDFRLETWKRYRDAVRGIPILVNSDANGGQETEWLLENMDVIALKQGMFSHGYHVSDNTERLAEFLALERVAKQRGKPVLTRGEMDGELFEMGWSKKNIPQVLYWSGLFANHCRLDIWNVPHQALKDEANLPTLQFFNKYAGHTDPATAPAAFCALRDGLDASDFERFPADEFGGKPGKKKEVERYLRIAKAYSQQGARMDDPEKAAGGGMMNRKRKGPNDAGWGILPGNYYRFLTQIDPGSGDIGRWNIDDSIYGRFGRSFDHASGKTQMRFKLDEAFRASSVNVKVIYLDKGTGSWSIAVPGESAGTIVQNTDSGGWKTRTVALTDVSELVLKYEAGDDTVVHLIEVECVGAQLSDFEKRSLDEVENEIIKGDRMKRIMLLILALFCAPHAFAAEEVEPWVVGLYEAQQLNEMPYRLMTPQGFDSLKSYPVIVSLHGGGGTGTDNVKQLRKWNQFLAEEGNRKAYPCYVLAPQTTELWNASDLSKIKEIIAGLPSVDMDRIYILGHSMGGHGTYVLTQLEPDYFAAAAPSAGSGLTRTEDFVDVSLIKDIPYWIFHGDQDPKCPIEKDQKIFEAMKRVGGNMKFTTWKGDKHGGPVALKMMTGSDNGTTELSSDRCDPEPVFLKWLFAQTLMHK